MPFDPRYFDSRYFDTGEKSPDETGWLPSFAIGGAKMYNPTMKFADLLKLIETQSVRAFDTTAAGKALYDKFISFADGRNDATIAAAFGPGETVTAAQVADVRAAAQTFLEQNSFANNLTISQGDRVFSWNKFR
jgi:hypothetical protein